MTDAIRSHQWPSAAISGHQWPSVAISGHQWPSAYQGTERIRRSSIRRVSYLMRDVITSSAAQSQRSSALLDKESLVRGDDHLEPEAAPTTTRLGARAVVSALDRGCVPAVLEEHGTIGGRAVEHEGAQRRPRAELPRPMSDGRERCDDQVRARDTVFGGELPEGRHDLGGLPEACGSQARSSEVMSRRPGEVIGGH